MGFFFIAFILTYLVQMQPGLSGHIVVQLSVHGAVQLSVFVSLLALKPAALLGEQIQPGLSGHVLLLLEVIFVLANTTALATNNVAKMPKPNFFLIVFYLKFKNIIYHIIALNHFRRVKTAGAKI